MTDAMLDVALGYVASGLSVIPIQRGTKHPAYEALGLPGQPLRWDTFAQRLPTDAELWRWFEDTDHQIAIVTGSVSGNVGVIDFDHASLYALWRDTAQVLLPDRGIDRLPVVQTGRGHHVYLRSALPLQYSVLAQIGHGIRLSETRGQHSYVLAPPSEHPAGGRYKVVQGDLGDVPPIDWAGVQIMLGAARLARVFEFPLAEATTAMGPWGPPIIRLSPHGLTLTATGHMNFLAFDQVRALYGYLHQHAALLAMIEQRVQETGIDYDEAWQIEDDAGEDE